MSLTLYSNYLNSAGERVRIALALKDIAYEYVSVRVIGWEAYTEINPQRLMPALRIDNETVVQSTAILEYLEERFPEPALLPADPVERARVRGFAQHITSEMHAIDVIRVRRFLGNELGVDQAGLAKWQAHWFKTGFNALETMLSRRPVHTPCCFSETPGWADLHLMPQVQKGLTRFGLDLEPYPHIAAVYAACVDHPAFIAARPEQQPDYPGELIEPPL
ncbi:MAG: maleylacetoacetate isomerase [Pseudomonadota bacterium]